MNLIAHSRSKREIAFKILLLQKKSSLKSIAKTLTLFSNNNKQRKAVQWETMKRSVDLITGKMVIACMRFLFFPLSSILKLWAQLWNNKDRGQFLRHWLEILDYLLFPIFLKLYICKYNNGILTRSLITQIQLWGCYHKLLAIGRAI